jgi:parvulin-like peptidyl-prolyl isomerase
MRFMPALLISFCLIVSGSFAIADDGFTVVATVNGVELTKAELNQEVSKIVPMEKNFHGAMSEEKQAEIRKKGMETLVNMELQHQDGLSKGQKLDKKALEREIDLLASKYPIREEYQEAVKKAGFSDQSMERFVSRNVIAKKMKALEVDNKINVTDAMVASYYEENKSKYMKPDEYRASLILVKVPPSSVSEQREEFRKKADDIYLQVKKGGDFADLASKYSDDMSRIKGGDLGYFHAGQSDDSEFDATIQALKVGETSSVAASLKGYYIVKLTDKKPPRQLPFEELKDKLKLMLVNLEKDKLYTAWMDNLKKKAKIVYPAAVQADKGSKP